jgi:hypothetical protein
MMSEDAVADENRQQGTRVEQSLAFTPLLRFRRGSTCGQRNGQEERAQKNAKILATVLTRARCDATLDQEDKEVRSRNARARQSLAKRRLSIDKRIVRTIRTTRPTAATV